jgi:peptide deformylase
VAEEPTTAEPIEADPDEEAPGIDEETLERRRQALSEVRQFGDPVLKSRASEVTSFGPELEAEAERMIALMQGALGIGLAATQLGAMRRMLVFQAGPDSEPRALVNPEVEWASDDLVTAEEGCLSLSGIVVDVERPLFARVSARDLSGAPVLLEAAGLEARVLQHEIDHLDGVLILDRTVREQRRAALRALRAGEHFDPGMLEPDPDPATEPGAEGDPATDGEAPAGRR